MRDYVNEHRALRRFMIQEDYQRVKDEQTSFPFIVNGLETKPLLREAARMIRMKGIPSTIKVTEDLLCEEDSKAGFETKPEVHITTNTTHNVQYRGRGRGRGRGRNIEYRNNLVKTVTDEIK